MGLETISNLLSTHCSSVAELGLEFPLRGHQVRPLTNCVVLSEAVLCILVPSFTKWEESCSGSSRVNLPHFLASGKPDSPVPTCEDVRFTWLLLWSEQRALPSPDFPGWGWPDSETTNLAVGRSPSHTEQQCCIFIWVSCISSREFSFSFLMLFWKKRNLLSGYSVLIFYLLCS